VKIITIITQVRSTIIEFPDNYLAIIDTGMADNLGLVDELAQLGYCPADFDLVINTHLYWDHIGKNMLFKNARICISRREYEYE